MNYSEFEKQLRKAIVTAAHDLYKSGMRFAVFKDTKSNSEFWTRTDNGGWRLRAGADPANAVRDIFTNGHLYATECATAMGIIYHKAVLDVYGDDLFNRTFPNVYLMDWDIRNPLLSKTGRMTPLRDSEVMLAGDRAYFANPDHAPSLPQWQGENVILLEDGNYYGHGIGISSGENIIAALNSRRDVGNPRSAYLMNQVGRPDFAKLAAVKTTYERNPDSVTVWHEFPSAVSVTRMEAKHSSFV